MTDSGPRPQARFTAREAPANGRRTQQERTDESKAKLIAAAMELIGENGYRGTTLADIGRRAGVSRGLVTYHFGTKEACIREMLEQIRTSTIVFADVDKSGKSGLAALEQLLDGYLRGYQARLPGSRAIFVAMVASFSSTPELHDLMCQNDESFRGVVHSYLEQAVEMGEVSTSVDLENAAIMIVGLARGIALQWLVNDESVDLHAIVPALQRIAREMVSHTAELASKPTGTSERVAR
jgi:AcrR family transcriptional regulator